MIITIQFKEYIISARFSNIIIYKLYYKWEFNLVILLEIDKNSKIRFYKTILLLSLTISLKVESDEKFLLNTKEVILQKPEN